MICPNCSSPIPEDAKFCPVCGSAVNVQPLDDAPANVTATAETSSVPPEQPETPVAGGWYETSEPEYHAEPVYTAAPVKPAIGSILDFYRAALLVLAEKPIRLSENEYFVLGDNRNNSMDSREENVGNIHRDLLIGKAWIRIYPFSEFGVITHQ